MGNPTQKELFPLDLLTKATNLLGLAHGFEVLLKQIDRTCESVAVTKEDEITVSIEGGKSAAELVVTKENTDQGAELPLLESVEGEQGDPSDGPK